MFTRRSLAKFALLAVVLPRPALANNETPFTRAAFEAAQKNENQSLWKFMPHGAQHVARKSQLLIVCLPLRSSRML